MTLFLPFSPSLPFSFSRSLLSSSLVLSLSLRSSPPLLQCRCSSLKRVLFPIILSLPLVAPIHLASNSLSYTYNYIVSVLFIGQNLVTNVCIFLTSCGGWAGAGGGRPLLVVNHGAVQGVFANAVFMKLPHELIITMKSDCSGSRD